MSILLRGVGSAARIISWLLRDEFITNLAAGSVDGTAAEPGPGTRAVTDTNSKISIASGLLSFATGAANHDSLSLDIVPRAAGRIMVVPITIASGSDLDVGWDVDDASVVSESFLFGSAARIQLRVIAGGAPTVGAWSAATKYYLALIMRAAGSVWFIKGGAFTNWAWLWNSSGGSAAMYPRLRVGTAIPLTADFIRISDDLWLPQPELSDGFAVANGTLLNTLLSDGLGHAEGVTGGIGAGGGGRSWSLAPDTYTIQTNKVINTPVAGADVITNGGFEGSYDTEEVGIDMAPNWNHRNLDTGVDTASEETTLIHGGASAQKFVCDGDDEGVAMATNATLVIGTWYMASVWARGASGGENFSIGNWTGHFPGRFITIVALTTSYIKYSGVQRALGTGDRIRLISGDATAGTYYVDDASIVLLTLSDLLALQLRSTQDGIMDADLVVSAGTQAGVAMNWDSDSSPANGVIAYHDGTNARLEKNVAGTWTEVISAAATYSANAKIRIIKDGTSYSLYYNGAKIGATVTISDAGVKDNKYHGTFDTYASNTIDNVLFRPRGSDGEYNVLDMFIQP